jgi:nucleotide-binding universal stress UspA family protein
MFDTVIVPLDGSTHAEFALPYAVEEAVRHGARIVLVHVVPRPEPCAVAVLHGGPAPLIPVWPPTQLECEEREWLAYLEGVRKRFGLRTDAPAVVAVGDPTRRVLDEAGKHTHPLIVMTTGDATAASRPPLSEFARRLMVAGGVSVLGVREPYSVETPTGGSIGA